MADSPHSQAPWVANTPMTQPGPRAGFGRPRFGLTASHPRPAVVRTTQQAGRPRQDDSRGSTMQHLKTKTAAGGAALFASAALAATLIPGSAVAHGNDDGARPEAAHARLNSLNNSGATGRAELHAGFRRLHIEVDARGVVKRLPHAMHIHFGAEAPHECPTAAMDDTN